MRQVIFSIIMVFLIAGCATAPKNAFKVDCGPYPEHYSDMIKCYLSYHLDDPSSLKDFTVIKPPEKIKVDTYYPTIPLPEGNEVWECFIVYDSKDSRGRQIDKDLHVVWIRDSKIVLFDYNDIELDFAIEQRLGDPCAKKDSPKN